MEQPRRKEKEENPVVESLKLAHVCTKPLTDRVVTLSVLAIVVIVLCHAFRTPLGKKKWAISIGSASIRQVFLERLRDEPVGHPHTRDGRSW